MNKDTPIYVASITKLYTTTVIMKLAEQGVLALEDKISKYLPRTMIQGIHVHSGKDYSNQITLRDLLSHQSGISDRGVDRKTALDQQRRDGAAMMKSVRTIHLRMRASRFWLGP